MVALFTRTQLKADKKRSVQLEIILKPKQRAADGDAYWKSSLDALVACGQLMNDSHVWCELLPVKYSRDPCWGTVINLTDIV